MRMIRAYVSQAARVVLAIVFAAATWYKVVEIEHFHGFLEAAGVSSAAVRNATWVAVAAGESLITLLLIASRRGHWGLRAALGWLTMMTLFLVIERHRLGPYRGCTCLPSIAGIRAETVNQAIGRNLVLVLVAWIGLSLGLAPRTESATIPAEGSRKPA